ncbi:hypothetical protein [Phenylobacterium sp.]|uniref:hypothetical protein n=1 Tax=Phenylobacterium sp. TaxID=1871053 RepID=UPI00122BD33C|nr:hypothetical protein [Phenylobacterium sp.]THD61564.1 MAG: hypothetical protein E8A49_11350 [Phenylobacterium sp.]
MFEGWDNFYLMIGGAAGGLIGLLFVVATLTGSVDREKAERGSALYLTPTVFHFAVVLANAAITEAPRLDVRIVAALLGVAGVWGFAQSFIIAHRLHHDRGPEPAHWSDFWCYGCAPGLIYLGQLAAVAAIALGKPWAPDALAAALLVLLLLSIRNAWDLVTTIAPMAARRD